MPGADGGGKGEGDKGGCAAGQASDRHREDSWGLSPGRDEPGLGALIDGASGGLMSHRDPARHRPSGTPDPRAWAAPNAPRPESVSRELLMSEPFSM